MMTDISWLSTEAQRIHDIFYGLFYTLITVFLLLGVFIEYFKWPLGGAPAFSTLIGRVLIAALLLHSYPEITNLIGDIADAIAHKLGDLNKFHYVLDRLKERLKESTWSWISIRDDCTVILSFLSFFLLYFSVHITQALLLYTWTLLYVFSPLLIALYTLPATSGATRALFRSLIEVCCWKIVWSVLATLMWSLAVSDVNKSGHDVSFVTSICLNIILAGSLIMTPKVVHGLAESGLSGLSSTVGAVSLGASMIGPSKAVKMMRQAYQHTGHIAGKMGDFKSSAKQKASSAGNFLKNKFHYSPSNTRSQYSTNPPHKNCHCSRCQNAQIKKINN